MKSIITCLAVITISLTFTVHTYAEIDLETARGIWLLDEGEGTVISDMSGNGNHGELQGGEWVKGPDGGSALSLNGQNDRVIIQDSESLYLQNAWTITSWVVRQHNRERFRTYSWQKTRVWNGGELCIQNKRQRHRLGKRIMPETVGKGLGIKVP